MSSSLAGSGRRRGHRPALRLLATTLLVGMAGEAVAGDTTWQDNGSSWTDPASWDNGVPDAATTAIFTGGGWDPFSSSYVEVGAPGEAALLQFASGAEYYTIAVNDTLTLGSIENLSGVTQEINVPGVLTVTGGTIAGLVTINATGFGADNVVFENNASAGSASINNNGGMTVRFKDQARGGQANIGITSGTVVFEGESDAETATIRLNGSGSSVSFEGNSTAGSADITSQWGMVLFSGNAGAGNATLRNDNSVLGFRTIKFSGSSTADNATIYSGKSGNGSSSVAFTDQSSVGTAKLIAEAGASITFSDQSDGADARFVLQGGTIGIDMSWANGDFTAGSLEGSGTVNIRNKVFVVGSNDISTLFDGKVTGSGGSFTKVGGGTLTLSGSSHTFSGLTTVAAGTLLVNGSLQNSAGIVVLSSGRLGGGGTLPGIGINGGTLAPGNSIGRLTVTGDLGFSPGSTYEVEVDAAGDADRTVVSGTATLDGTVRVLAEAGSYAASTDYTILSAGTIVGSFGGVTSNLAFLTPTLSYVGSDVILTLTRNAVALPSVAETPNQKAAAGGVDALGAGNSIHDTVTGLSAEGARAAYDALSGEIHASLPGLLLTDDTVRRAMTERTSGKGEAGAFLLGEGSYIGAAGDGNAAAAARWDGEMIAGADTTWETGRVGVLVHAGAGQTRLGERSSSASDTSYGAGAFGRLGEEGLQLGFGADISAYDIRTERHVQFGGVEQRLQASYGAQLLQGYADFGYRLALGDGSITPFANLAQMQLRRDGFSETGGSAALSANAARLDATQATFGVRSEGEFRAGEATLTANGTLAWRHGLVATPEAALGFAGGSPFSVLGPTPQADSLVLEGDLGMNLGEATWLRLSYDGQVGTAVQSHAVKASLSGRL